MQRIIRGAIAEKKLQKQTRRKNALTNTIYLTSFLLLAVTLGIVGGLRYQHIAGM